MENRPDISRRTPPELERLRQAISEALDLLDHDQKHGAAAILRAVLNA